MSPRAVKESLGELYKDCWLVSDQVVINRAASAPPKSTSWPDGNGSFFFLSKPDANVDPLTARPVDPAGTLPLIYAPGRTHAVWRIGEAFLKITIPVSRHLTPEHETINALRDLSLSFALPKVLFHGGTGDRQYLIISRVPGTTISTLWPSLDANQRRLCAVRVAETIVELASKIPTRNRICGIDGKHLSDLFLAPRGQDEIDVSPGTLLQTARALDMEQDSFLFYHCDIGPGNVLFTDDLQRMSVIDWETAGFVPREWVRSKLILSRGFDLDLPGEPTDEEVREYATLVDLCLKEKGFLEVADRYRAWLRGSTA